MTRILIVDDEPDVVEYLSARLSSKGFQTGGAADGVEAVINILRGDWDVVLMDIRMPNLDGINALRIIRTARPNLPVVTFTGQAGQGDMAESVRLGAYTCLLKPVSMDKLLETIKQAISTTP